MVMPIRDEWRRHAFHSSGFRPLGLCLRHPQVITLPILEARLRYITLNTQNGGSYSRIRVMVIDVDDWCRDACVEGRHHARRYSSQQVVVGQVPRQSWTPLPLNHMWTEPPLQHEDTAWARHVIAGGMVGKDTAGVV